MIRPIYSSPYIRRRLCRMVYIVPVLKATLPVSNRLHTTAHRLKDKLTLLSKFTMLMTLFADQNSTVKPCLHKLGWSALSAVTFRSVIIAIQVY